MTLDGLTSAVTIDLDPNLHPAVLVGAVRLRTRAVGTTLLHAMYTPSLAFSIGIDLQGYLMLSITSHSLGMYN